MIRKSLWKYRLLLLPPQSILCAHGPLPQVGIQPYSTSREKAQQRNNLLQLHKQFDTELSNASESTLDKRFELYEKIKHNDIKLKEAEWCCFIVGMLPYSRAILADYLFACEALAAHNHWDTLKILVVDLCSRDSRYYEEVINFLTRETLSSNIPISFLLDVILSAAAASSVDLANINRYKNPILVSIIEQVMLLFPEEKIASGLEKLKNENPVAISVLATAFLRCKANALIESTSPPIARESPPLASSNSYSKLWKWKLSSQLATPTDLELHMAFLVYTRRCAEALKAYDENRKLHANEQFEMLFLAAAGDSDYDRLQNLFEEIESNPKLKNTVSPKRYEVVLRTLGFLGRESLFNDIYLHLKTNQPEKLTRGLFHALIFGNMIFGNLVEVMKTYHAMITHDVAPTTATFNLVLRAFRDNLDVKAALLFWGNEMIDKYQLPVQNSELSLILSLCAAKRDLKTAQIIWNWATGIVKPNHVCWNAYLQCYLECNDFITAWEILNNMRKEGFLSIEALTVMMHAVGRNTEPHLYFAQIMEVLQEEELSRDSKWYNALFSALIYLKNYGAFRGAWGEMKKRGIIPTAVHYAYYIEALTKSKQFDMCDKVMNEARINCITFEYPLVSKFLRSLNAPGSSKYNWDKSVDYVTQLVKEGSFDPYSSFVPRSVLPVYVVKPVIRKMIKDRRLNLARQLLDSMLDKRANQEMPRDMYQLWALYMEIFDKLKEFNQVDRFWNLFIKSISAMYTLNTPAVFNDAGEIEVPPVYKIPRRFRKVFWKQINIRIIQLREQKRSQELFEIPQLLTDVGLELSEKNFNDYTYALLSVGEYKRAFDFAFNLFESKAITKGHIKYRTAKALSKACKEKHVDFRDYGAFGELINSFKDEHVSVK